MLDVDGWKQRDHNGNIKTYTYHIQWPVTRGEYARRNQLIIMLLLLKKQANACGDFFLLLTSTPRPERARKQLIIPVVLPVLGRSGGFAVKSDANVPVAWIRHDS